VPWAAFYALGLLALILNVSRPLEGADPYHLQRVSQIERLGTLAYDPQAEIKVNVLATVYELVLADLDHVPWFDTLLMFHGVLGLLLYALAVAATRQWLGGGPSWCWNAVFAVPVVFHQLVLVKNDLFGAIPVSSSWPGSSCARPMPANRGRVGIVTGRLRDRDQDVQFSARDPRDRSGVAQA
jgi:hypothetical protein